MNETERATGEWLDRELNGLKGDALLAELAELAPQVSMSVQQAANIYRRYRYELRFSARHFEVNRKYGVQESTYDPGAVAEMIDASLATQNDEGGDDSTGGKAEQLAETAGSLLDYLQQGILKDKVEWVFWQWRQIKRGERLEVCEGAGERRVRGKIVSWLTCAVLFIKGDITVAAFPEARVRRYRKRKHGKSAQIERMEIVGEQLNFEEVSRRCAAMLRLYRGDASGLRSQVHLAKAAGVSKQAVSDMQLRMKQHYQRATGGRALFAKVTGAGPLSRPEHRAAKQLARDNRKPAL